MIVINTIKRAGLAAALLGLAACGAEEKQSAEPVTRPVKTYIVSGATSDTVRTFPGRVDADKRADLAFRVGGQVQEILVKEGDLVEAGQVLARLDPTDYKLVLEDRKANFDNASSNFKRAQDLVVDGNISRMDFDRMEANFRSTSAALSAAEKDLEYTVMESPFRGRIAQRKVEKFEEVTARQTVFTLQSVSQLDVVINLPERVVRMVRGDVRQNDGLGEGESEREQVRAFATFEGRAGQEFSLTPKEIATKADDQTQTFKATFSMEAPREFTVLPGMTVTVTLDLSGLAQGDQAKWVPERAVQADSGLEPRVWVLDPASMTVSAQAVGIGRMSGGNIEITSGLAGGEEIVSVGAPYLAEGMRVSRMAQTEQAVPRAADPS